jgi:hypothetical protein
MTPSNRQWTVTMKNSPTLCQVPPFLLISQPVSSKFLLNKLVLTLNRVLAYLSMFFQSNSYFLLEELTLKVRYVKPVHTHAHTLMHAYTHAHKCTHMHVHNTPQ